MDVEASTLRIYGGQPPRTRDAGASPGVFKAWARRFSGMGAKNGRKRCLLPSALFRRMRWHRLFLEWLRSRRAALCLAGYIQISRKFDKINQII